MIEYFTNIMSFIVLSPLRSSRAVMPLRGSRTSRRRAGEKRLANLHRKVRGGDKDAGAETAKIASAAAKKERARAAISLVNIFFVCMTRGEFSDLHWYYIILIFAARPQVAP